MKKYPAMAFLEFVDIPSGILASDAMVKESPLAFIKAGTVSHGRYLTVVGGSTAAVEEAVNEARECSGDSIIDQAFLPDIHPRLHDAVLGTRQPCRKDGALAVLETTTTPRMVQIAEVILKAVPVDLIEIRLADSVLSGKGVSIFQGELFDIEEAVDIAGSCLKRKDVQLVSRVLTRPHETTLHQIAGGTSFHGSRGLHLDGEVVEF